MESLLSGVETEYGLAVEGRGPRDQVEDSKTLVRSAPVEGFLGWDYRAESPRADLRGFKVEHLSIDPEDARFETGTASWSDIELRADRVLLNGARLYNDHGHPEYSTPECFSLHELAQHDRAGERIVLRAAKAFARESGRAVTIYKNNTDYSGASYGTHESCLAPRALGFEKLYEAVVPMLVARMVLCGSGKVGHESAEPCLYQMSQRADFFTENASVDTLYRRPVFNTRDECHADPRQWIRVHVIAVDANMNARATLRGIALLRLAVLLAMRGEAPVWRIEQPPVAMRKLSRAIDDEGRIELEGGNWTTPRMILESYLDAAEQALELDDEMREAVAECRTLLDQRFTDFDRFSRRVDWACKLNMLRRLQDEAGLEWNDPMIQSLDLAYHNVDPNEGLFHALTLDGSADDLPEDDRQAARETDIFDGSRALARSAAVTRLRDEIETLSWGEIAFKARRVALPPDKSYPDAIRRVESVEEFISIVESL